MDITLGLDFGTHQTKACLSYMPNNETVYEFMEFPIPGGAKTTLLPSIIQVNRDGTIRVGSVDYASCDIRPVPPPERPVLPERPSISIPKEPDMSLPPEPVFDTKAIFLSYKEAITGPSKESGASVVGKKSGKKAKKKKIGWDQYMDIARRQFKRNHEAWNMRRRQIREKHLFWERKVREINDSIAQWQRDVDTLNADYKARLAHWQTHKTEYRILRYFKQAAFTHSITWGDEIAPDILSVWYLTYVLLHVKAYVEDSLGEVFEESVSIQMGVPSGLNDGISRLIQYRGRRVLLAARQMMDHFSSPEDLTTTNVEDLLAMTVYSGGDEKKEAEMLGLVVIPEAYACLQSLTFNKRLSRGLHLLVDIGGGTTDVVFFTITETLLPAIHTVESLTKGLNFVIERFLLNHPKYSMGEAQELLRSQTSLFIGEISAYTRELQKELDKMVSHVLDSFNRQMVGTDFGSNKLIEAMTGKPIVYGGGGAVFKSMLVRHKYFTDKRVINKDTLNIPNLLNRDIPISLYTILATAYGLSIPSVEDIRTVDLSLLWAPVERNARSAPLKRGRVERGDHDD